MTQTSRQDLSLNDPLQVHRDEKKAANHDIAPKRRLRILWVKVGGLWPINSGGRLRSFHIISELSRGNDVSVITTHQMDEDKEELHRQLPRCELVSSVPHISPKRTSVRFVYALMRSWLTALPVDLYKSRIPALSDEVQSHLATGHFDLCVADFLFAVPNVPLDGPTPVVFFSHNVEYMIWRRLGTQERSFWKRALLEIEWRKMRRYETQACTKSNLTITVSEQDRQLLGDKTGVSKLRAIPTGVDLDYFQFAQKYSELSTELVFTGSMDWHPNEDAMLYFMQTILPLIRDKVPEVTLTIVGRNPTQKVYSAAASAGVKVTGTVDDVRPYITRAAVYIVPLRVGGGTRLKIYEALAVGKAVVSTTIGAEGLPLEEGLHILRADDPQSFAQAVIDLLGDSTRRERMGSAGRSLMEKNYGWSTVAKEFEQYCREVVIA